MADGAGRLAHAASVPTMVKYIAQLRSCFMVLLLLEAFGALLLLLLIVWWTMFSGRKGGELHSEEKSDAVKTSLPDKP